MRLAGVILGFLLLFPCSSKAFAWGLEAAVGGWQQDPEGVMSVDAVIVTDALDLEEDLKYSGESRIFGRAKVDMPPFFPDIYLMATPMEFDGTSSRDIQFTFGGEIFEAGVPFYSKVTLHHYDIALYYALPFVRSATTGVLNLELGINARVVDFKAEAKQEETGTSASETAVFTIPMVYLGAQVVPVQWLSLEGEARAITYKDDHFYSLIGRVKVRPLGPVFFAGGWRHDDADFEEEGITADLTISGPFLEAGLEF
jgi:outer membrane protein